MSELLKTIASVFALFAALRFQSCRNQLRLELLGSFLSQKYPVLFREIGGDGFDDPLSGFN